MLGEFRTEPRPQRWARYQGNVRPQLEQFLHSFTGFVTLAKLPIGCGQHRVRRVETRQINLEREAQCAVVVAFAVGIEDERKPVPSGMMRIEMHGLLYQSTPSLPVSGVRDQRTQMGEVASIDGVQFDGPFRRSAEGLYLLPVEENSGQGLMAAMTGRVEIDGRDESARAAPDRPPSRQVTP